MKLLEALLLEDKIYQIDLEDARILQSRYEQLELSLEQRMLIDDYIPCLNTASQRKCETALRLGKVLGEISTML